MATKAEFLTELFNDNPDLRLADAKKAWKQAGNEGEISESSYYHVKQTIAQNKKGAKKSRKTAVKASKPKGAKTSAPKSRPSQPSRNGHTAHKVAAVTKNDTESELDQMEADIDDLIFKLSKRDDTAEIQQTLRSARRQIARLA